METTDFDFWMFIAGLGIFLFGMHHLEVGLKGLAGKAFKKLLRRFTDKTWKGVLTGTAVTAILQSSSMVTLLVLAFLGGGIISLKSSLGVVLGANLGTTFTAWIVAALGFKMEIADLSFPFLAIGIMSYLFLRSRPFLKNLGGFLIGFGLLFLGLDFMKDSIEGIATSLDLTAFAQYGLWGFLVTGLVVTALIQSSSAMIVIILSALNAGLIDLHQAVAMVIGANIGTTFTLVMGSLGGTVDKKRLSLANILFKVTEGILIFFFIDQFINLVNTLFALGDPLMELVLMNTLINVFGILLFYPLLPSFEKFLNRRFVQAATKGETLFIKNIPAEVPDVALQALDRELEQVFFYTRQFILECFRTGMRNKDRESQWAMIFRTATDLHKKYEKIKRLEDEILVYYSRLQEGSLSEEEATKLTAGMMGLRSLVFGAKDIKDVIHNIRSIRESEDQKGREVLKQLRSLVKHRLQDITVFLDLPEEKRKPATVQNWLLEHQKHYNQLINHLYHNIPYRTPEAVPVSTLTNLIRQTFSSLNNLCSSLIYWKFNKESLPENLTPTR